MRPRLLASALLFPVVLSAACLSGGRRAPAGVDSATLEVRSSYLGPINIFLIRDNGFAQRIASAITTSRPVRIRLGPGLISGGGAVRIIAVPLAENGRASTGTIVIRPGDTVQFNIGSDLAASSVFVR